MTGKASQQEEETVTPMRGRRKSNRSTGLEYTREIILKISARRFAEFGFEVTTVREVAAEAEILSGSIYHHFTGKDEILHEIIRAPTISMGQQCEQIAQFKANAEHRLIALILLSFNELFNDADVFAILYNERAFFRRNLNFDYVVHAKAQMFTAWKNVLEEGIKRRLFRKDLDLFLAITTIIRMLNTCADWHRHEHDFKKQGILPHSRKELVDFNVDLALRAVRSSSRIDEPITAAIAEKLLAKI
jgi:AcrR family transcriptional regulator